MGITVKVITMGNLIRIEEQGGVIL